MANTVRSEKTKIAFLKYLEEHPNERFWQSIRNFSGYAFILASDVLPNEGQVDTFYFEEKNGPGEEDDGEPED